MFIFSQFGVVYGNINTIPSTKNSSKDFETDLYLNSFERMQELNECGAHLIELAVLLQIGRDVQRVFLEPVFNQGKQLTWDWVLGPESRKPVPGAKNPSLEPITATGDVERKVETQPQSILREI